MKILQVIHGYPIRYNAGSEVYTQTLCHELANRHDVRVFTREEDSFAPDFQLRVEPDPDDSRVTLHVVNNPRNSDRYQENGIDRRFSEVLKQLQPDIVHFGHLNHLSISLPHLVARQGIPVIFTLHDYWIMCPRSQFIQRRPKNSNNIWAVCSGQKDQKCAKRCYARYFGGASEDEDADVAYWTGWVNRRMHLLREMTQSVDRFVAPSRYLRDRFRDEFGVPEKKLYYLDYGFDLSRMQNRKRISGEPFTFGYIGTHIPAKGIHDLIHGYNSVTGNSILRIWGRPRGQDTAALKSMTEHLQSGTSKRVEWIHEYRNQNIIQDVFNRVDAIVVPSIWVENSPLVIHEAQQARVPVITADVGGMAEYVNHEINGLLFKHRTPKSLTEQMQRFVDDPSFARHLGERGYLYDNDGNIPDITTHVNELENLYEEVTRIRTGTRIVKKPGPWRITLDTNPDTCNMRCIMCEEHSPHSPLQHNRRKEGKPRREMALELLNKAVSEAAALGRLREIIPSTMGEPLLYEHFEEILALCNQYDVQLNLTTNGTFPRLGVRVWAEQIVPVASDVKISWNGATKETQESIMLGSNWEKVLDNVKNFITVRDEIATQTIHRCRVTFQVTFMEMNIAELDEIVRLAISLGVDRVKGHHLWAHFDAIKELSMRRNPDAIRRWNNAVKRARNVAQTHTLPNGEHILLENIFRLDEVVREDLAPGAACPFLGQEAWVSSEGRFNPCCAPDAQRLTLGEFGNLNSQGFADIWNGKAYESLIATYGTRDLCLKCNMRKPVQAE